MFKIISAWLLGVVLLGFSIPSYAQTTGCTTLGQTPETAFPICGNTTFQQTTVPLCSTHSNVVVPGCSAQGGYPDANPFWYKFTCYAAGTLAFLINPINNDDYDWELYDITGHNPEDVFTDGSLVVAANWAGTYGPTGASASGVAYTQCGSDPADHAPTFAKMPVLKVNHTYLLLVSHFSSTQFGYSLSFGGGTAVITDTVTPRLAKAVPDCDQLHIVVRTNKRMQCASLATDGSDFIINPGNIPVTAANAPACGSGFDMDSLVLTLGAPLPVGNYQLVAKNGKDANTLLDNCGTPVPEGYSVPFAITPPTPTPLDSITPVACGPQTLQLVFDKPIQCSTISPDGSDFTVTGPSAVTVTGATGNCNEAGESGIILLHLAAPITVKGDYTVTLRSGSDGNTVYDHCGLQTPNSTIHFYAYDTVSAAFTWQIHWGCKTDTVQFYQDGNNEINQWKWTFDSLYTSTQQNPIRSYDVFGDKQIQLTVSNGVCTDSSEAIVPLGNALKAAFTGPDNICVQEMATFTDSSTGQITSYAWNFGNGITSFLHNPPGFQYTTSRNYAYQVSLVVKNTFGCTDTARRTIMVYSSCYIAVPSAFTPNGDGLNDYLYPLSGFKADNIEFQVYNRLGQRVFESKDWQKKWDGTIDGTPQPPGTFVWTLSYTSKDTGQRVFQKGTTVLIR